MSIRAKVGGKAGARMFVPRDAHRVVEKDTERYQYINQHTRNQL